MPYNYEDFLEGTNYTYTATMPQTITTGSATDYSNYVDWMTNYTKKQSPAYYDIDVLIDKICKVICEHVKLDITEDELIKLIKEPD